MKRYLKRFLFLEEKEISRGVYMKFYQCSICGNIIELVDGDISRVRCCGKEMDLMVSNVKDAAVEKHVPFTDIEEDMVYVKVGEVDHPMTEDHYITWVAAVYNDSVLKYNFKPGEVPEAVFDYEEGMVVYAYCNLHGLWKKEL